MRVTLSRPLETPAGVSRARLALVVEGTRYYHGCTNEWLRVQRCEERIIQRVTLPRTEPNFRRRESQSTPVELLFRIKRRNRARREPTPSMDATILRRRRVYCPHHRPPPAASTDLSLPLALSSFLLRSNHVGLFPYHAALPTTSFPFDPLLPSSRGLSCPTGVLLQNLLTPTHSIVLSSFLPRPFPISIPVARNPDPSTTSLFANDSPTLFLSFVIHLALTYVV